MCLFCTLLAITTWHPPSLLHTHACGFSTWISQAAHSLPHRQQWKQTLAGILVKFFLFFFYFFPIRSKVQILCTLQGEESPCRASWQQHMLISDFCLCIQYTWELHPLCSSPNPSHRFSQVCVPTVPGSRNTDSTVQCTNIFNNLSVC